MTTTFEAGKTYACRSICDHNTMVTVEVVKRTAKTITARTMKGLEVLRVSIHDGAEHVALWGHYSMAPSVGADQPVRKASALDAMLEGAVAQALGV